jgi:hypothetical protein
MPLIAVPDRDVALVLTFIGHVPIVENGAVYFDETVSADAARARELRASLPAEK